MLLFRGWIILTEHVTRPCHFLFTAQDNVIGSSYFRSAIQCRIVWPIKYLYGAARSFDLDLSVLLDHNSAYMNVQAQKRNQFKTTIRLSVLWSTICLWVTLTSCHNTDHYGHNMFIIYQFTSCNNYNFIIFILDVNLLKLIH